MFDLLEKAFLAGYGAVSLSKKKTEEFLDELKESCSMSEAEGRAFLEKSENMVREGREKLAQLAESEVRNVIERVGLVPRQEYEKLLKRVEALEDKLRNEKPE